MPLHQLILGPDVPLRDKALRVLKARFLKTPEALKFDLNYLDAQDLAFQDLKAALLTLPAVAERRVVFVSRAEKLDEQQLELIEQVIDRDALGCVIVLEAAQWDKRVPARKRLAAKLEVSGGEPKLTAFDLFRDLPRDRAGMLARLGELLEDEAVENILGALRWWWCHEMKRSIAAVKYKKGLLVIQEADQRIKLSGLLSREQSIEVALVKLSSLIKA